MPLTRKTAILAAWAPRGKSAAEGPNPWKRHDQPRDPFAQRLTWFHG